ncbi:MAG: GntR family transcriptional regulator [Actinobacteria bacterium]|nr:GntR family transcriptional regulator [Actinomycetota bacterium]
MTLTRSTTGEEVADALREQIMDGTLAPGTPLREVGLAEEFDVSRRTVQDALAVLAGERLVRHERHRGARVAQLTRADVEDLYTIRLGLELMAARRAREASPAAREGLEHAYEELQIATSVGRADDIVARDLDFHRAVVGLLESPRIDVFFGTIASELRYALSILESFVQEASKRPKDALREHAEIRDALLAGDEKLAARLITEHVDTYRERLVSGVEEEEEREGGAREAGE